MIIRFQQQQSSRKMDQKNLHYFESNDSIVKMDKDKAMPLIVIFVCRLMLILSHGLIWLLKMTEIYITYLYHHIRSYWLNIDSKTKACLTRIPVNLAICIGLEDSKQIDMDKIGQLICWCQTLSIQTLTIYHYCDTFPEMMNTIDGIQVQTISLKSSHQSLIESARNICQSSLPITIDRISEHLRHEGKYYRFDDPDLLICFNSDQRTLQAFPLWQIRLTEIFFLTTHRHLNKSQFLYILKRFSRCQQRFGK